MKPLNLSDAMKLGTILYPHIPDDADDGLDFVGTIISNIKDSGNHREYLEAASMFCDHSVDDLIGLNDTQFMLEVFAEGIVANNLLDLKTFFELVGFDNGEPS